ncbi:MAG: helix-turn-helix domain-containing protein [Desulfobacteraceae bacterium]|nr:helix-turn-helix domain-containing protein [Desulfobacteraceae bacterium]
MSRKKNNSWLYFFKVTQLQNITPNDNLIFNSSPVSYIILEQGEIGEIRLESKNYFAAALRHFLINKPKKSLTQKKIAELTGLSQSFIGQISRGGKRGSESNRRKIAAIYGFDGTAPGKTYDDFLSLGKRLLNPDNNEENSSIKIVNLEHKNLIEAFQNKAAAYEINKKLLEIEKTDPDKFKEIQDYIDFIHERIEAKKIANDNSE